MNDKLNFSWNKSLSRFEIWICSFSDVVTNLQQSQCWFISPPCSDGQMMVFYQIKKETKQSMQFSLSQVGFITSNLLFAHFVQPPFPTLRISNCFLFSNSFLFIVGDQYAWVIHSTLGLLIRKIWFFGRSLNF